MMPVRVEDTQVWQKDQKQQKSRTTQIVIAISALVLTSLLVTSLIYFKRAPTTSAQSFNSTSKAINVRSWSTCIPGDSCADPAFQCCIGPADKSVSKSTCRRSNLLGQYGGCASPSTPSGYTVHGAWQTCSGPCEKGYTCCTAPADILSGKKTCRRDDMSGQSMGCSTSTGVIVTASTGTASPDESCGYQSAGKYKCGSSKCCSAHGWCGTGGDYCGTGCQSAFGSCLATSQQPVVQKETWTPATNSFSRTCSLTYYDPQTGGAYCDGYRYSSSDLVVAMSTEVLLGRNACGKYVTLKHANGRSVRVKVVDMCNTAHGCRQGNVDGTVNVWNQLGVPLARGVDSVSVTF